MEVTSRCWREVLKLGFQGFYEALETITLTPWG